MLTLRVSTKLMNALTAGSKKVALSRSNFCRYILESYLDKK